MIEASLCAHYIDDLYILSYAPWQSQGDMVKCFINTKKQVEFLGTVKLYYVEEEPLEFYCHFPVI